MEFTMQKAFQILTAAKACFFLFFLTPGGCVISARNLSGFAIWINLDFLKVRNHLTQVSQITPDTWVVETGPYYIT